MAGGRGKKRERTISFQFIQRRFAKFSSVLANISHPNCWIASTLQSLQYKDYRLSMPWRAGGLWFLLAWLLPISRVIVRKLKEWLSNRNFQVRLAVLYINFTQNCTVIQWLYVKLHVKQHDFFENPDWCRYSFVQHSSFTRRQRMHKTLLTSFCLLFRTLVRKTSLQFANYYKNYYEKRKLWAQIVAASRLTHLSLMTRLFTTELFFGYSL